MPRVTQLRQASAPNAVARVRGLITAGTRLDARAHYFDALDRARPPWLTPAQVAMNARALAPIYERLWRPLAVRSLFAGRSTADEEHLMHKLLAVRPTDAVLDVCCGPGNTTRRLLGRLGDDGVAVGLDAAPTMLTQAIRDTDDPRAVYVRGDAQQLPFRDASFDTVTCYAALYMLRRPSLAIDEMARVLARGGRIALLTTCHRGPLPMRLAASLVTWPSGIRMFGPDEIPTQLAAHGLIDVRQEVHGFLQVVGARKPHAEITARSA